MSKSAKASSKRLRNKSGRKSKAPREHANAPVGVRESCPLRIVDASSMDASRAAELGFEGLFYRVAGQAFDDTAFKRFTEGFRKPELAAVAELPWRSHAETSRTVREHPEWFEAPRDTRGVVDPRQLAGIRSRTVALAGDGQAEDFATWLLAAIEALGKAGVAAILLPSIDTAPDRLWEALLAKRSDTSPWLIGGTAEPDRHAGLGFDALMTDADAYPQELAATPLLVNPDPSGGAEEQLLRGLVTHDGYLLKAAAAERMATDRLRSINALQQHAKRKGPSMVRRFGGGTVRFDNDPQGANEALAIGPMTGILRALGGGFSSIETLDAQAGRKLVKASNAKSSSPAERPSGTTALAELAHERIAIENVYPLVDGGRFPAKRVVGDVLEVGADIFCDGHDKLAADLIVQEPGRSLVRVPMEPQGNDRWTGRAILGQMGLTEFDIEAWRDVFGSWCDEVSKKRAAGQNVRLETIEGHALALRHLKHAAGQAGGNTQLAKRYMKAIEEEEEGSEDQLRHLLDQGLRDLLRRDGPREQAMRLPGRARIRADREQARFSSWYELFPRSMSGDENTHGTFRDVIDRLPYIKDLGFDVLYFPPIHPIGETNRKGPNNSLKAEKGDVGSPYAIGSKDGGHDALHPELGSFDDFAALIEAAASHDMEIALDFAIQCSPDHPWLKQHPEWFDWRPDGSIKFAENPPKKYEDIVNVHFYGEAIPDLWHALRDVVLFWCEKGVRIFRVDNPHTKPYPFWEWMIAEVKTAYPDALFLSEAFTRPKVMRRLAKLGFTQSYTYFTWRNTKAELSEYVHELTQTGLREVMNPNFFVNTPDINPPVLQTNNRDAYIARTWLAGTLASSYGIYNGVEIAEGTPLPGKEEYLDSEKYQLRAWDMDRPGHIKDEIRLLNELRREHPALQDHATIRLLTAYNDQVMWYAKATPDLTDVVLIAVSLDFERDQRAHVEVPLWYFGLPDDGTLDAYDVFAGQDFSWTGKMQEVTLGPGRIVRAFVVKPPAGFEHPDDALYADRENLR
jgi:starch synthase (maltosyl-transferring)